MTTNEVPLREARKQLGHLADRAEHHGETIIVTRYGRPSFGIVPISLVPQETTVPEIATFTHPEIPRLVLRAAKLGDRKWTRELVIDGQVAHTAIREGVHETHDNAEYQASQEGLWLAGWSGDPAKGGKDFGPLITGLIREVEDLGHHVANGKAIVGQATVCEAPTGHEVGAGEECELDGYRVVPGTANGWKHCTPEIPQETAMTTEIYDDFPGRSIASYELLDEMQDKHGLGRREAHESIHAFLEQCVGIDGRDAVIISSRPARPELLEDNPSDLDVRYWLTITGDAADTIREAFAAVHAD